MKPIDIDRAALNPIQQPRIQEHVKVNHEMAQSVSESKREDDSIMRLLSLVSVSEGISSHLERLAQIKAEIDSDSFQIDYDALANNILVSEYEL